MSNMYLLSLETSPCEGKVMVIKESNLKKVLQKLLGMEEGKYYKEELENALSKSSDIIKMVPYLIKLIRKKDKYLKIIRLTFPIYEIIQYKNEIKDKLSENKEEDKIEIINLVDYLYLKKTFDKDVDSDMERETIKEIENIIENFMKKVIPKNLIDLLEIKSVTSSYSTVINPLDKKTLHIIIREKGE